MILFDWPFIRLKLLIIFVYKYKCKFYQSLFQVELDKLVSFIVILVRILLWKFRFVVVIALIIVLFVDFSKWILFIVSYLLSSVQWWLLRVGKRNNFRDSIRNFRKGQPYILAHDHTSLRNWFWRLSRVRTRDLCSYTSRLFLAI